MRKKIKMLLIIISFCLTLSACRNNEVETIRFSNGEEFTFKELSKKASKDTSSFKAKYCNVGVTIEANVSKIKEKSKDSYILLLYGKDEKENIELSLEGIAYNDIVSQLNIGDRVEVKSNRVVCMFNPNFSKLYITNPSIEILNK